ncbi:MAG: hypothetical protein RMX65_013810 [Nostoc sp. DedQUE01]
MQQAIATNLVTLAKGHQPSPAKIKLRKTLLKLGLGESATNLFERFEITGKLGHVIREATYLQLLPAPAQNLKATSDWLTHGIRYRSTKQQILRLKPRFERCLIYKSQSVPTRVRRRFKVLRVLRNVSPTVSAASQMVFTVDQKSNGDDCIGR